MTQKRATWLQAGWPLSRIAYGNFKMKKHPTPEDWSSCTWEGAEAATLQAGLKMTFAQKLRWLEEMQAFVDSLGSTSRVREGSSSYDATDGE